ncbi:unnamed protein product [Durusdinium trenchii]|uniref:Uncharacterized protein n=1 Tax=Durusdinium trenchii TaxID=1381693 RepID=A0ABP0SNU8_9DINO
MKAAGALVAGVLALAQSTDAISANQADFDVLHSIWTTGDNIKGGKALKNCIVDGGKLNPFDCSTGCTFNNGGAFQCDNTDGSITEIYQGTAPAIFSGTFDLNKLFTDGDLALAGLSKFWIPPQDNQGLVYSGASNDNCFDYPLNANWFADPAAFCFVQQATAEGPLSGHLIEELKNGGNSDFCDGGVVSCSGSNAKLPVSVTYPSDGSALELTEDDAMQFEDALIFLGPGLASLDLSGLTGDITFEADWDHQDAEGEDCLDMQRCYASGFTCTMPTGLNLCPPKFPMCEAVTDETVCNSEDKCFFMGNKCVPVTSCADFSLTSSFCDWNDNGRRKTFRKICRKKKPFIRGCSRNQFATCKWDKKSKSCVDATVACAACDSEAQVGKCCRKNGNKKICNIVTARDAQGGVLQKTCEPKEPNYPANFTP